MTHPFHLLGNRWRLIILWKLIEGLQSKPELNRAIPIITRKMLYQDLKRSSRRGLLLRVPQQRGSAFPPAIRHRWATR